MKQQEEAAKDGPFECGLKSDNTRNGGTGAPAAWSVSAFMSLLTQLMRISTFTYIPACCAPVIFLLLFFFFSLEQSAGWGSRL